MDSFEEKRQSFQSELIASAQNQESQATPEMVQALATKVMFQEKFDPNIAYKEIMEEQLAHFAKLVKDTQNEMLIAYKDPKVQELVDFILNAIIFENEILNRETFPIQIYSRYKADLSLENKLRDWYRT